MDTFQPNKENDEFSTGDESDEVYVPEDDQFEETDNEVDVSNHHLNQELSLNTKVLHEDNNTHIYNQLESEKDVFENSPNLRLSKELQINKVEIGRDKCKKYFCKFCNKLICKFVRHLEVMHKEEKVVHDFLLLPKGKYPVNQKI